MIRESPHPFANGECFCGPADRPGAKRAFFRDIENATGRDDA